MIVQTRNIIEICVNSAIFIAAAIATHFAQSVERPITAVLIFLTGVILISARSGVFGALFAAVAASVTYNFLLSEPVYQFGVTTADEIVPLAAFNISALVAGILVGRLRDSAKRAYLAQSDTAFLLTVSDRLQSAIGVEEVEAAIRGIIPRQGVRTVEIYLAHGNAYLRPSTGQIEFDQLKPFIGAGAADASSEKVVILELEGVRGPLGIVKFQLAADEEERFKLPNLQSLAALLALATERCLLLEEVTEAQALIRSEALKDALLSSVSHDLRTPVTVIQAAAGALNSREVSLPDHERHKLLAAIIDQCRKLDRYTAELLDVGQIQSGISGNQLETVDLKEVVQMAIKQARSAHPAIWIERNLQQSSLYVKANAAMLEQAIYNLIDNAYKFGGAESPILIELESDGKRGTVAITDNGAGIEVQERGRVFTRFFRGAGKRDKAGMGLGLFISKGFVEAFSGTIEVESPVAHGKGTRFLIRLPLVSVPRLSEHAA